MLIDLPLVPVADAPRWGLGTGLVLRQFSRDPPPLLGPSANSPQHFAAPAPLHQGPRAKAQAQGDDMAWLMSWALALVMLSAT